MTEPAISVRGLRMSYGALEAVKGISFDVQAGEVFAILGPNGAGKTTTVEILEGHRRRTGGEVSVLGFDPARGQRAFRERIGIVLQETGVEPYLTVEETVQLYRGYYPDPLPADQVLELVGLTEQRRMPVRRLSGGQQRRLDVAVGMAGNPDLLFLDEPTTGFDPAARRNAWQIIRGLKRLGKTVLLTTHYLDEAEKLADRVAIIAAGEIVARGTPAELIAGELTSTIRFRLPEGSPPVPADLRGLEGQDGGTSIRTTTPTRTLYELLTWAVKNNLDLEALTLSRPSLEDVYLRLVGHVEEDRE